MCNAYNLAAKVDAKDIEVVVNNTIATLGTNLIRRTAQGIVVTGNQDELAVEIMRWGFDHPKYREVNNTRASSLKSPFWAESLAERRCIVPMSSFYEWEEVPDGAPRGTPKRCFQFRRPDRDWLWVAGLWQSFEAHGNCYSTITTEPAPPVWPIHDRELAVLDWEDALAFLASDKIPSAPYEGELVAAECPSPLKGKKADQQGELF